LKKILLIEDDNYYLKQKIKELKQRLPYQVISIHNKTKLETFQNYGTDDIFIVLLDNFFAEENSKPIIQYFSSKGIAVIVYTELYDPILAEEILKAGALDYVLKKPYEDINYTTRLIERTYNNQFIKALVVDGSEPFVRELSNYLMQFGIKYYCATTTDEAKQILNTHEDIKLLLVDEEIQGNEQGILLIEDIRKNYSSTQLVIIAMSLHGYNSPHSIAFLKKGANDFITKPFIKEQFSLRIMQNLETLNMIEEKHKLASTDFLTKLNNRLSLSEIAPSLLKKAKEADTKLAVAMIDIDHFKQVNDTHGHDMGDAVLKHLSQILINSFRKGDLIVRNGGEEFCIILDKSDIETAKMLIDRLRENVENNSCTFESITLSITISVGLFIGLEESIEVFLTKADTLLYQAKEEGRNRVICNL
jgi:diguanylate cyclase (GGDEF)-like protein